MIIESCAICVSPLRSEIEKRDNTIRAMKTIAWAKSQGVNINKFVLAKHRANHMNGNGSSKFIPSSDVGDGLRPSRIEVDGPEVQTEEPRPKENESEISVGKSETPEVESEIKSGGSETLPYSEQKDNSPSIALISDQHFLDTVRDMVYQMLVDGKIELKVDSAFKAIEIKHKIAEESQNEKMLLEILNEIRKEELGLGKAL